MISVELTEQLISISSRRVESQQSNPAESLLDVDLAVFQFREVFELIESTYKFYSFTKKRTVATTAFWYDTLCKSSLYSRIVIITQSSAKPQRTCY